MNRRILLLCVYFITTPVILFSLIFYSLYYYHEQKLSKTPTATVLNYNSNFEALPDVLGASDTVDVDSQDARIAALETFFKAHRSPLAPHARQIVEEADLHGFDYRLLPAIAMQESNLCKKLPKGVKNNCWGFGIYAKKKTSFDTYPDAIRIISKTLAEQYIDKGLISPEEIMTKYTPGSNGSWAEGVNFFMDRIDTHL